MLNFVQENNSEHLISVYKNDRFIGTVYRYFDPELTDHFESYDVPYGLSAEELYQLAKFVKNEDEQV